MNDERPLDDQPNCRDFRETFLTNRAPSLYGPASPPKSTLPATEKLTDDLTQKRHIAKSAKRRIIEVIVPATPTRYTFHSGCLDAINDDLTTQPPEHAGAMFGPMGCGQVVSRYVSFPATGTATTFAVDGPALTKAIRELKSVGLELRGIVHSHPSGVTRLSWHDVSFAVRLLNNPKNSESHFFMPIVCDGEFYPYVVDQTGGISEPEVFSLRFGGCVDE